MANPIRRIHDDHFNRTAEADQSGFRSPQSNQNLSSTGSPAWSERVRYSRSNDYDRLSPQLKRQTLDGMPSLFESTTSKPSLAPEQHEQIETSLVQQISQLKVENDWLKKKLRTS